MRAWSESRGRIVGSHPAASFMLRSASSELLVIYSLNLLAHHLPFVRVGLVLFTYLEYYLL